MASRLINRLLTAAWLAATVALTPMAAHSEPISATIGALIIGGGTIGPTATGAAIYGALTAIGGFVASAAVSAALTFGISAISGKSKPSGSGGFAQRASGLQTVGNSAIPNRELVMGRVRKSGSLAFIEGVGRGTVWLQMVLMLASHECEEIEEVFIDEKTTAPLFLARTLGGVDYYQTSGSNFTGSGKDGTSTSTSLITMSFRMGTDDQVAEPYMLNTEFFSPNRRAFQNLKWKESDRLRGICYLYLDARFSEDKFQGGRPNVTVIMKGANQIYDPRDGQFKYTNNWALCARHYLKTIGVEDVFIDDDSVIASANISDEDVDLKEGGTQKRYTFDGTIDFGQQQKEVLEQIAVCGGGAIIYSQGKYRIYAGAYDSPSHTITADWVIGDVEYTPRTNRNESYNAIKGIYVDGAKTWQPVDFPPITNAAYESQDGGKRVYKDVEYPFVNEVERAQRLASIQLRRHRASKTLTMPLDWRGLAISAWDVVTLSLSELNIDAETFRVVDWSFNPAEGVVVTLREENASLYTWDEATARIPDPEGELDTVGELPPPGAFTVTESLYTSTDGSGLKTSVVLSWTPAGAIEDDPTLGSPVVRDYIIAYKLATDTDYGDFTAVSGNTTTLLDFTPGVYDFQIYAITASGRTSETIVKRKEIFGLTAKPSDIANLSFSAISNQAHLKWDEVADIDVKVGGTIRIKHSPLTTGAVWETATQLVDDVPGNATAAVVPLVDGTYLLKAIDSTGNQSENATLVISDIVNLFAINIIKTSNQNPNYLGTKTNMVVDGDTGYLKLDTSDDWDDVNTGQNIDDWTGLIDSAGGVASSGEYLFYDADNASDYYDLGDVYTTRLVVRGDAIADTTVNQWDELYPGINIDSWPGLIDGEDITGTTVSYQIRTTSDDPSGTPTWSDWEPFVIGDYTARGIQVKAVVANDFSTQNIFFRSLSLEIDLPDREEQFLDEAIAAAGTTLTYDKPFYSKPEVGVSIQSAQYTDTVDITHVTSGSLYTGVTIKIVTAGGGTGSDRTCDVYVKGF